MYRYERPQGPRHLAGSREVGALRQWPSRLACRVASQEAGLAGRRATRSRQTSGYRMRDWFVFGMFAGVIYSLWKNPGGCACAGGCLVILAILAAIAVFAVVSAYLPWILVLAVVVVAVYFWNQSRPGL